MAKDYNSIIQDIRKGQFSPIYFLYGEEPYYIDQIVKEIEQRALSEEEKGFNQSVFYGNETDMVSVVAEARRYPMMAERVVVIVKEAQQISNWDALQKYATQPTESTVLVFAHKYKKPDKRKAVFKTLSNHSVFFESEKVRDWNLPAWIEQQAKLMQLQLDQRALLLLVESLGTDLGRIVSELNKLLLVVKPGGQVSAELVEEHIGISREYNNFELINALANKDLKKALQIQQYFAANPKSNPLPMTVALLHNFFSRMLIAAQLSDKSDASLMKALRIPNFGLRDYKSGLLHYSVKSLAQCMAFLRECDMRSKGVQNATTPDHELLRELLCKIAYV